MGRRGVDKGDLEAYWPVRGLLPRRASHSPQSTCPPAATLDDRRLCYDRLSLSIRLCPHSSAFRPPVSHCLASSPSCVACTALLDVLLPRCQHKHPILPTPRGTHDLDLSLQTTTNSAWRLIDRETIRGHGLSSQLAAHSPGLHRHPPQQNVCHAMPIAPSSMCSASPPPSSTCCTVSTLTTTSTRIDYLDTYCTYSTVLHVRTRRPSPPRPRSAVGRLAMRACLTLPMLACACLLWPALRADECPSPHPTLSSPLLCQGPVVPRRSVSSLHTRVHCRPVPPFARRSGAAMYASTCLACGCCSTLAAPQDAR